MYVKVDVTEVDGTAHIASGLYITVNTSQAFITIKYLYLESIFYLGLLVVK